MDPGFFESPHSGRRRPRGPVAIGVMLLAIGVVLGGASVASAFTTDTRDFAARHHSVLRTCAL